VIDDALSDDAMESFSNPIVLPPPDIGNLPDIEHTIRAASSTQQGREALVKFIIREEYVPKLIPLVEMAEDLESLQELHRLCNIMKSLILLNDNSIIEHVVTDGVILGVVGALEYDPDFPTHKANHRQYLSDTSRYKEVVPIKDPLIKKKIRHTWRLQYLKDVVLARILDDPTFSVLNSLIFFNQVDIVQHLQSNASFLKELFAVFDAKNTDTKRKEDAVHFLHQCAAIAKNLQAPARANLFSNFIAHGLFQVITFAVKHPNASMRTTGIDILVALLDHDPTMMRGFMLQAVHEKKVPLTDTLIELLHAETDLGVKNQLADAIKVLLDPQAPLQDSMGGRPGGEFMSKLSRPPQITPTQAAKEQFAQDHFDRSCKKPFVPLKELESRHTLQDFTYQEVSLHSHLVEILTFFIRQHSLRSRHFVLSENLPPRVAQLLSVPQKPLKLTALKFFRTCVSLQDQFYANQITQNNTFDLILDIVIETMPRDNLLNSACLDLFEFIKRENIKAIILHVVETYREKLKDITFVDTFQNLILRYEQMQGYNPDMDQSLFSQDEDMPPNGRTHVNGGQRWGQELKEMDPAEEEYFNTSDDDEEEPRGEMTHDKRLRQVSERMHWHQRRLRAEMPNGNASPLAKPLVDYPDDEDDDSIDTRGVQTPLTPESEKENASPEAKTAPPPEKKLQPSPEIKSAAESQLQQPPERLSEKRRREEDEEDDELVKLSTGSKRRNSSASNTSSSSLSSIGSLRRKKSFLRSKQAPDSIAASTSPPEAAEKKSGEGGGGKKGKKIAITLTHSAAKPEEKSPPMQDESKKGPAESPSGRRGS
jgi:protein phosphatase 4 regulatory subunit 3